ncbi:protein of unknown function [Hyphomicrobium sp. MC1]|nr:protein of unknown function [Hyphomicrobium sp. MC1]
MLENILAVVTATSNTTDDPSIAAMLTPRLHQSISRRSSADVDYREGTHTSSPDYIRRFFPRTAKVWRRREIEI